MHEKAKFATRALARKPLALALTVALGIAPLMAAAATISVSSTADPAGSGGTCTLRQAIITMNHGSGGVTTGEGSCRTGASGFGIDDTIVFDTSTFPSDGSGTITLTAGRLDIDDTALRIDASANGNVTIDAHHASGVMVDGVQSGGSLILKHLTVANGTVNNAECFYAFVIGGGICIPDANLTVDHGKFIGNSSGNGGAIWNNNGSITLTDSTLSGNSASGAGGAISSGNGVVSLTDCTLSGNTADAGGGMYAHFGIVTINRSTLDGNSANYGGGIYATGGTTTLINSTVSRNSVSKNGGGILTHEGTVTLINSTVSGNSAVKKGGGLYTYRGQINLTSATVSSNTAGSKGGGVFFYFNYGVTANRAIVAGNSGGDIDFVRAGDGIQTDSLIGGDPMLGTLGDNGGPTQTMLPQSGSPAIDAATCHDPGAQPPDGIQVTDQRDKIRPDPGNASATPCDIGAVETNSIPNLVFSTGFE